MNGDWRSLAFTVLVSACGLALAWVVLGLLRRTVLKGMLQIELRHFFYSPIAWLTMACFSLVNGYVFIYLFEWFQGQPNEPLVRVFFGEHNAYFWILQLIVIPGITMRLIAEERASGTLETLLTAPVTEGEVIFSKFLAAWLFYVVLWLPTLCLIGAAFHYATPDGFWSGLFDNATPQLVWSRLCEIMDLAPVLTAYLGTYLMGAAWIAVGLLSSSFCQNQVVAFITSFVALLILFSVGFFDAVLLQDPSWLPGLREALRAMSFPNAFDAFPRGVVDSRSVVYFGTLTVLALFLSVRVVESGKWR